MFFSKWLDIALYKKKPEEVVKENPSLMEGLKHYVIANVLLMVVAFFSVFVTAGMLGITIGGTLIIFGVVFNLIGALIGAAIFHFVAKLLGGKGTYSSFIGSTFLVLAAVQGT